MSAENSLYHAKALLTALGGSLDGWEYTGDVFDVGQNLTNCACGHPIRFVFVWRHADGRTLKTGSTCVNTLPGLGASTVERMEASIKALEAKRREAEAKARKAAAETEVAALRETVLAAIQTRFPRGWAEDQHRSGWLGSADYEQLRQVQYWKQELRRIARLKTPHGQKAALNAVLGWIARTEVQS